MTEMVEKLRNIALIAHGGAGKTSLAEAMLYDAGVTKRFGRVDEGNAALDFEPEELKRKTSISTAFHQFPWKKHRVNIIDTPGDQNFFSDTRTCMQAADAAVVVIDAVDGVKVQTELGWDFAGEFGMPCLIFINKLDRERASFSRAFDDAAEILEPKPIALQLPIGEEDKFNGIVDLVSMKAYTYDESGKGKEIEIPEDMADEVESARESLVENVAEADDELLERYLEGETLSDAEIKAALKKGTLARKFVPLVCGSALKNIGIDLLQDHIVQILPSPMEVGSRKAYDAKGEKEIEIAPDPNGPFSAYIFKTVADPYAGRLSVFKIVSGTLGSDGVFYNVNKDAKERFSQLLKIMGKEQKPAEGAGPGDIVAVAKLKESTSGETICDEKNKVLFKLAQPMAPLISFSVLPKSKGDEDKIFSSLQKLLEEDTALKVDRNAETKEILLSGLGNIHIEVAVEKLKRKFNVEVALDTPKVPYRETIRKKVRVQGKHKKQTGGHGQYGDCWVQMEPLERGGGFEFVDAVVGGVIPKTYIPAVEKGIVEAAKKGVLGGFPCIDFRATLDFGSYHAVDSSEMAFKIAGSLAFKKASLEAQPVLLEPIMKVKITCPDEYMGDVMGDLNGRRGRVLGMDNKGKNQIVIANVPMAEMLTYAPDLRSMTGGRGIFSMEFSHYDEVPAQIAQKIIDEANKAKE
jgi:elongation factor G